ncbi:MAG: hypothetical protein Q8P93_02420 [bacterium]|nr:hypothetical protein [bacterium]
MKRVVLVADFLDQQDLENLVAISSLLQALCTLEVGDERLCKIKDRAERGETPDFIVIVPAPVDVANFFQKASMAHLKVTSLWADVVVTSAEEAPCYQMNGYERTEDIDIAFSVLFPVAPVLLAKKKEEYKSREMTLSSSN